MDKQKRQQRFLQKARNRRKWERRRKDEHFTFTLGRNDKTAKIQANHGKLCSCHMCGNPRRHYGVETLQEVRANDRLELGVYYDELETLTEA